MTADFNPVQKGTIMLLSGSKEHLFFICNDPVFYPKLAKESFLAVNLTSIAAGIEPDSSCLLNVGDHPFVRHPSYVLYRRAEIFGADSVIQRVSAGDIRIHDPCSEGTFQRILGGFNVSPHVRPVIKNYYQKYCVQTVSSAA
ncbi:hypothetical protein [Atlantibacter hermannii]|uniref:hypothetical protein n=1 Tax=Atlantibacter hermannii TaxID=565 RepID=UPI002FDE7701